MQPHWSRDVSRQRRVLAIRADLELVIGVMNGFLRALPAPLLTSSLTFTMPLLKLNDALQNITFVGHQDFHGPAKVMLNVTDNGVRGLPGALTSHVVIDIDVTPVNDQPVRVSGLPAPPVSIEGRA